VRDSTDGATRGIEQSIPTVTRCCITAGTLHFRRLDDSLVQVFEEGTERTLGKAFADGIVRHRDWAAKVRVRIIFKDGSVCLVGDVDIA